MNLHEIASGAINAVNPFQEVTITPKSEYTVNQYGEAEATAGTPYTIMAQIQPVSSEDIAFISDYNQSTVYRSFWVSANPSGINRPQAKGGDIVTWGDKTFYVAQMPEAWYETAGWNHFIGVLQL